MTTALPTQTTWSVNRLAARAVALHTRDQEPDDLLFHDEARQLLEMLGLVEPGGREILPDDTRPNVMVDLGKAPGGKNPDASSPLAFADHGRRPEGMTTPPGLATLSPLPAPAPRTKKKPAAKASTPARTRKPRPYVPVPTEKRKRAAIAECGTTGGYARHVRLKEPVCTPCREAKNAYWHDRDAQHRQERGLSPRPRKKVAECGTRSGYMRHLRLKEPTCAPCRAANAGRRDVVAAHAETNRLISAGVNPQAAAILGERTAAAS